MPHVNARLTEKGRLVLCQRIASGRLVAHVAAEMGVSRPTAYRWWNRYRTVGEPGLVDRPSRPHRTPTRTRRSLERKITSLRTRSKLGPARIGARQGLPASTVHRVLVRHRLNRLAWLDRPTGEPIRRYEHDRPGALVHVDIKKLGRLPAGGGWRAHGRGSDAHRASMRVAARGGQVRVGYDYVHSAVDDHSRLAYSEVLSDETATTTVGFWTRAHAFFAAHRIPVQRVLTDNGGCYRSRDFAALLAGQGVTHKRTRPYRPQANGKVERFNRTLLAEWAYVRTYTPARPEPEPCAPGSTPITSTAATPHSAATHPSPVSPTSRAATARRARRRRA